MISIFLTLEMCIVVVKRLSYLGPKVWDIIPVRFKIAKIS